MNAKRRSDNILLIISLIMIILSIINAVFVTYLTTYTFILLLIDFILLICWTFKRRAFAFSMLAACLSQLFFVPAVINLNFLNTPYQRENSIRIASYNVARFHFDYMDTAEQILSIMEKERVDVVCFQEFVERSQENVDFVQILSTYFPYNCIQEQEFDRSSRLAIFSRYPIEHFNKELFRNNLNSSMFIDVTANGRPLRIFNNHLQTTGVSQNMSHGEEAAISGALKNSQIREQQAKYVAYSVSATSSSIVLCGDFNDIPTSYSYRVINRTLKDGFKQGGSGLPSTFIGRFKNLLRIDYIFNSKDMKCTKYTVVDQRFSDHKPVIASLEYQN